MKIDLSSKCCMNPGCADCGKAGLGNIAEPPFRPVLRMKSGANLSINERYIAAQMAGDYLVRNLGNDGYFVYEYTPCTDSLSTEYNWLRHAGSIIALCQLYRDGHDSKYLQAAKSAIQPLLAQIQSHEFSGVVHSVLAPESPDNGRIVVKTGGCALAAIALLMVDEMDGSRSYQEPALDLCRYLQFTQKKSGALRSKYIIDGNRGRYSSWQSTCYQGEALLAMSMAMRVKMDPELRRSGLRLLAFLVKKMRLQNEQTNPPHEYDHWANIGIAMIWEFADDRELAGISISRQLIIDTLLAYTKREVNAQIVIPSDPHFGCFGAANGRTQAHATRIEGLDSALQLLTRVGEDAGKLRGMTNQVELARVFLVGAQYKSADTTPGRKLDITGGFRAEFYMHADHGSGAFCFGKDRIRIDSCQHAISAMLGWKIFGDTLQ